MGDRVYVSLTVLKEDMVQVSNLIPDAHLENYPLPEGTLVSFGIEGVNYGEVDELEQLRELGIPYDSKWGAGCGFVAGYQSLRFNEQGDAVILEQYQGYYLEEAINECLQYIEADPSTLPIELLQKMKAEVTPLPWDNQKEYARLYLAKSLITPKE